MEAGQHTVRQLPECVWAAEKGSQTLCLLAIAQDKRLWASLGVFVNQSHPKSSWQFLILSLCASVSGWLQAGGLGGAEECGAGCSDQHICPLSDVTEHQILHEKEKYEGDGAAVLLGPLGEIAWGDTSHHATPCLFTVPTAWPGQLSQGRWGKGGNVLHFTETASRDTPREASFT